MASLETGSTAVELVTTDWGWVGKMATDLPARVGRNTRAAGSPVQGSPVETLDRHGDPFLRTQVQQCQEGPQVQHSACMTGFLRMNK